ncbi:MAG: hypothetical protein PHF29_01825 [Candidatus Riflebacteria bacterium]|nr:hypothetical protein [Candidatus Riflebacteria bacterium]
MSENIIENELMISEEKETVNKPQKAPKKQWKPDERFALTRLQKALIGTFLISVPLFFFIILPIIARNHFSNFLKIPPEIFLTTPQKIVIKDSGTIGSIYKLNINGYEFSIPQRFTPSKINENGIDLTDSTRSDCRHIYLSSDMEQRTIKFSKIGIGRWFMPNKANDFMDIILNANWHPVRLMFKAQFYAHEGLNSKVYESNFGKIHKGYIYPSAGQKGFIARVFNTQGPGYFDFHIKDPVNPPTLKEWINYASKILPLENIQDKPIQTLKSEYDLESLIDLAIKAENESEILSVSLNEYFRTKSPEWLIPVAQIMLNREYFPDLIDLHQQYTNSFEQNPELSKKWENIKDRAVEKILKIDIDSYDRLRELNIFCKNLTKLEIEELLIKITVTNALGKEKSFNSSLITAGRILPSLEKKVIVKVPEDITLVNAQKITAKVMQVNFLR